MEILVRALQQFIELVVPEICCHCLQPSSTADCGLCMECRASLQPCKPPFCKRCSLPLPLSMNPEDGVSTERLCGRCAGGTEMPVVRAYAQFAGELLPGLLIRCKYGRERHLARPLADLVWLAAREQLCLSDYDAVVPVPLHDARLLERGFNQSVLLAGRLCRESGLPLLFALRRVEPTRPQALLDVGERGRNLRGSFRCLPKLRSRIAGSRLLLVDDVVTTGQTVIECAQTLHAAGALQVDVVCLARTPQHLAI
jgi:ComF family protein